MGAIMVSARRNIGDLVLDYFGIGIFFLFFGIIASRNVLFVIQDERIERFNKKCLEKGGVMFEYKSAAAAKSFVCIDPKSIIPMGE